MLLDAAGSSQLLLLALSDSVLLLFLEEEKHFFSLEFPEYLFHNYSIRSPYV